MITDDDLHRAIDRIAHTSDGVVLYLYLQKRLMGVSVENSGGALRLDQGERRFAFRLIGLMAKGISESGGRNTDSTSGEHTGTGDKPIVFAVREPVRVAGSGSGSRRRIGADTIVPGWNDTKPDGG